MFNCFNHGWKIKLYPGHFGKIYSVDSVGQDMVASAAQDGSLIIWDTTTHKIINKVLLRSSWVMAVAGTTDGKFVFSGGLDNCVTQHNVASGATVRTMILHQGHIGALVCSSDSQFVYV